MMDCTILDCYTDEPAGLGVPPYLGVYPRYIAGSGKFNYITIDDLRLYRFGFRRSNKTDIKTYNATRNIEEIKKVIEETDTLYAVAGVHTPGKYLSAVPGTLRELHILLEDIRCKKILTGPAVYGTQLYGGKISENDIRVFDKVEKLDYSYDEIKDLAVKGAAIISQIPDLRIIEIETSRGCSTGRCSFCTEPLKNRLEFRPMEDILAEIRAFYSFGCRYFRLGKQSCIYSYPEILPLLKSIRKECRDIKVLHIDNVNPKFVVGKKGREITQSIATFCTSGNVAAMGIESFDTKVIEENNLNCDQKTAMEAIKIINKFGSSRGDNGLPKFLPGINLIFGLKAEDRDTHKENMLWLNKILKDNLLVRRINIRQLAVFEGTQIFRECRNKFLKKNKRYYWKWRNEIRQNIDNPMLKKIAPIGTILKDVRAEIYDGNTTFARQVGTYPLAVGIRKRLQLKEFYNVKVTGHMLRSIVGEI